MIEIKEQALDISLHGEMRYQEPMRRHTSWHAGGFAQRAYVPFDLADLSRFLRGHPDGEPITVIGLGSNILVRDGGIRGVVICLSHPNFSRIELVDGKFRCGRARV